MTKSSQIRLLIFATVSSSIDTIKRLLEFEGYSLCLVGLLPDPDKAQEVSGFVDITAFCQTYNLCYYQATSYNLNSKEDQNFFNEINFEILLTVGWQRLIPDYILKKATIASIGLHGSPEGITAGRGRSPQNWALIRNAKEFRLALFCLEIGIDSGPVILEKTIHYSLFDDISTSYKKIALASAELIREFLEDPSLLHNAKSQSSSASYYPKRIPRDGFIDWHRSTCDIYNFVRALTKPYPCAQTTQNKHKIAIVRCVPFDKKKGIPGVIDFVFEDDSFLVFCKNGRLLVLDYYCNEKWEPVKNAMFVSADFHVQLNEIIKRHTNKYPDLKISDHIIKMLKHHVS